MSICANCGEDGRHFSPAPTGPPDFSCKKMGNYYLALRFAYYRPHHTTLVYYGPMNDSEVGTLAAYITDIFSVSAAHRFDLRFDQKKTLQTIKQLEGQRDDLPEWVQDLAMMSDNYDCWAPFINTPDDAPLTMEVSHVALMSGGEEFFKWELGETA